MSDSKPSAEKSVTPARRMSAADVFVALGILLVAGGAGLVHVGLGVMTLGAALVLVGARGLAT